MYNRLAYYQGYNLKLIITDIIYGINDYLKIINERNNKITINKIYYNRNGSPYIIKNGHRIKVNDFIKW